MEFNINKYDNVKFDEKDLTHKKIKVLLLWFEYHEVYQKNIPLEEQIPAMDIFLLNLQDEEIYEVLLFFKNLREEMVKRLEAGETDIMGIVIPETAEELIEPVIVTQKPVNVSEEITVEPYLTTFFNSIIRWFRVTFKK